MLHLLPSQDSRTLPPPPRRRYSRIYIFFISVKRLEQKIYRCYIKSIIIIIIIIIIAVCYWRKVIEDPTQEESHSGGLAVAIYTTVTLLFTLMQAFLRP